MKKLVLVLRLAKELNITSSALLKKLKKQRIYLAKVPVITESGTQMCSAIDSEDAQNIRNFYTMAKDYQLE